MAARRDSGREELLAMKRVDLQRLAKASSDDLLHSHYAPATPWIPFVDDCPFEPYS